MTGRRPAPPGSAGINARESRSPCSSAQYAVPLPSVSNYYRKNNPAANPAIIHRHPIIAQSFKKEHQTLIVKVIA